jgi:hypothetical protein
MKTFFFISFIKVHNSGTIRELMIDGLANPAHGKVVSDLRRLSLGILVSSTNKTDHHDIAEILLKGGLKTITNQAKPFQQFEFNR